MADLTVVSVVDTFLDSDTQAAMRTNIGLVIGTNVQAYSALLAAVAGITPTDGVIVVGNGTTFVGESGATARTSLGLGSAAIQDVAFFATAAQGALADSATQPGDLGALALLDVATFGLITEATTSRTLALPDASKYIRCTSASPTTVTVPPQASVAFGAETEIIIEQAGAGQVTIAAGSGVTVNSPETLLSGKRYGVVTLKRVGENSWVLGGNLQASA